MIYGYCLDSLVSWLYAGACIGGVLNPRAAGLIRLHLTVRGFDSPN